MHRNKTQSTTHNDLNVDEMPSKTLADKYISFGAFAIWLHIT